MVAVYTGGAVLGALGYGSVAAATSAGAYGAVIASGAAAGFAAGVTGGLLTGASLTESLRMGAKGALFGAVSAGVANAIGGAWGASGSLGARAGRAMLHGLSRAVIAKAQGGRWSAGFWSGFASSALSPLTSSASTLEGKVALSAVVGGTASELGGGKFANGAVTAAFVMMYNEMGHGAGRTYKGDTLGIVKGFKDLYDGILSVPRALINYGDFLARISGFRDWQNDNVLPWNKWEAEAEYKVFMYALKYRKSDIAEALMQDIANRPNYYIGGVMLGSALGYMSKIAGACILLHRLL